MMLIFLIAALVAAGFLTHIAPAVQRGYGTSAPWVAFADVWSRASAVMWASFATLALLLSNTGAMALSCEEALKLRSAASDAKISFSVTNESSAERNFEWIDFDGKRDLYGRIAAGEKKTIETYIGHPWIFSDESGNCVEGFLPTASQTSLVLAKKPVAEEKAVKGKFTKTSAYSAKTINGFSLLISPDLGAHESELAEFVTEFTKQSRDILDRLPPQKTELLQSVKVWVERESDPEGAAVFHVSKTWLIDHNINPAKTGSVEISNARNFVAWSKSNQPSMLLHELAHAYHFLRGSKIDRRISASFKAAKAAKTYEKVEYNLGGTRRAYALDNKNEYFAELTEAYFGSNDYFPFNREDLKRHDPTGYQLMAFVWEK